MACDYRPARISATFTEAGPLGLKFTPNKETGGVEITGINAGTQAETHTQLEPGLALMTVGVSTQAVCRCL